MNRYKPVDLTKTKRSPLRERKSKVDLREFASPYSKGADFYSFLNSLPDILAAKDLKEVIKAVVRTFKNKRVVAIGMGAHPIKVGLSPVIIDLMERGIITSIALNGAGIIHDFELAMIGQTSEEVASEIDSGSFGMADETGRILNEAIKKGVRDGKGIGEAVGSYISSAKDIPYINKSILASAFGLGIPVTVHVAIGTDIIHMHPSADGSAIGEGSLIDFRIFSSIAANLEKGVYINIGSSVIMPEVFLKAITIARNLGYNVKEFTTVNMDFLRHYRPITNILNRPTQKGGKGYSLIGHHEIMLPLLAAGIIEELSQ
ncbi:MAG: hypothetical protein ACE5EA_10980 [Nitrospirota bacterium]